MPSKTSNLPRAAAPVARAKAVSWVEVGWASLIFFVFASIFFRAQLKTGIYGDSNIGVKPGQGLTGYWEADYQFYPAFYFAAEEIHKGLLPLWTPYSCGGTPFIGKQQTGVFAPSHLLFYLVSTRYFKYLWLIFLALRYYMAWIFTFLLARWYGADFTGSLISAGAYVFSSAVLGGAIEDMGQAAAWTPALFFMLEQFLSGERTLGMIFLPWTLALPFIIGHFETGVLNAQAAAIYWAAVTIYRERSLKWQHIRDFAICAVIAMALSAGQIAAGLQYVAYSYVHVWRTSSSFGWSLSRIPRQLTQADAAIIAAAIASLVLFFFCLVKLKANASRNWPRLWTGAAMSLAVALACLMNLGMPSPLFFFHGNPAPALMLASAVLFSAGLIACADSEFPFELKILSALTVYGLMVSWHAPILTNILYRLPMYKFSDFETYNTTAFLGLAILAGWGISRASLLAGKPWQEKKSHIFEAGKLISIIVAALSLCGWLSHVLADHVDVGTNPQFWSDAQNPQAGGIMDAGNINVYSAAHVIRGWVANDPQAPIQAVGVGLYKGPQTILHPAPLSYDQGRAYFRGALDLSLGGNQPIAMSVDSAGHKRVLRGSPVQYAAPPPSWITPVLVLAALACVAMMAMPWGALALSMLGLCVPLASAFILGSPFVVTQSVHDFEWPFISQLKKDNDIYRIYSPALFSSSLFPPAVSETYGIADIRNGDDNLDVLATVDFLGLANSFLAQNPATAYSLLGLANVKYVLSQPNQPLATGVAGGGLEPFYSGADMLVYRNFRFQSFAQFKSRWQYIDGGGLSGWAQSRQILSQVGQAIASKSLDPQNDLLLNEEPPEGFTTSASGRSPPAEVDVLHHDGQTSIVSVNNAEPGFLFLSTNDFPGWKAYVDGRLTPLLRAWIAFCAVPLKPGKHIVYFVYDSALVNVALALSALAALFWLWWWRKKKFTTAAAAAASVGAVAQDKRAQKNVGSSIIRGDGAKVMEVIVGFLIGSDLFFWLNWCAWRYKGGILSKIIALAEALLGRKPWGDLAWHYPYDMGVWSGIGVNVVAASTLCVIAGLAWREFSRERRA